MRKWIIPGLALAFALSLGNVATSNAMTSVEKIQKETDDKAANEASSETKMSLMANEERVIPASGSLPCVNGQTLDFTFVDGVLTISGAGDALTNEVYIPDTTTAYRYYFNDNSSITSVVFTDDCQLTSLRYMFNRCKNLASVTNIPDTVTDLDDTFTGTALTSIPELPAGLTSMSYTFAHCEGITSVDFSTLPQGVKTFSGIFKDTGIITANLVITNPAMTGEFSYSYALADCKNLETVTFDATGLNDDASLWLQGICDGCPVLETFELINIPATNKEPGSVCSSDMFN